MVPQVLDPGGKQELMDSSSQSASSTSDEFTASYLGQQVDYDIEEAEPHIHLPNPSYWPILLSMAIAVTVGGVIFASSFPWVSLTGLVLVLIFILGWAFEDPMAQLKEKFVTVYRTIKVDPSKFKIGQNVVDSQGKWLGKIQARFSRYILVERGRLIPTVYYVPQSATRDQVKNNRVFLTLSEEDLVREGLNRVPDDLYEEAPEAGVPTVRGAAQFARRPLSPAETGHYHYGRRGPGINTDASGSYHREEILPTPQTYVTEDIYTTDEPIPAREINPV